MSRKSKEPKEPAADQNTLLKFYDLRSRSNVEESKMSGGGTKPKGVGAPQNPAGSSDQKNPVEPSGSGENNEILLAIESLKAELKQDLSKTDASIGALDTAVKAWQTGIEDRIIVIEGKVDKLDVPALQYSVDSAVDTANTAEREVDLLKQKVSSLERRLEESLELIDKSVNKNAELIKSLQRRTRESNVRIQGVKQEDEESPLQATHRYLSHVVPDLKIEDIESVEKIVPRTINKPTIAPVLGAAAPPPEPTYPPTILIKFKNRQIRDKVYYEARRNKEKFPSKVIVREDMIRADRELWGIAKTQMAEAFTLGVKTKFEWGKLTINGQKTKVKNADHLKRLHIPPPPRMQIPN